MSKFPVRTMFKKISEQVNKSISNFLSQSQSTVSDESFLAPSGTVNKNWCDTCRGKGCCIICKEVPCTLSIGCSGKGCKKRVHHHCDPLVGDKVDMVDKYYCPPCRRRYPKSRKTVTYFATEQQNGDSNSINIQNSNNDLINVTQYEYTITDTLKSKINLKNIPYYVPSDTDSIVKLVLNEILDTVSNVNNAVDITEDSHDKSVHSNESFKSVHSNESFNSYDDDTSSLNEEVSDDSMSNVSATNVNNVVFDELRRLPADFNSEINEQTQISTEISSTHQNHPLNKHKFTDDHFSSTPSKTSEMGIGSKKTSSISEPNISVSIDDSNYTVSLSDIISNFSKELSNKEFEIFSLKSRIETLENENFEGRFVPKEKRELESLRTENLEQKNIITNQDLAIRDLERREETSLERLNLAHQEVELLRSGLDKLNKQLHLKPDHIYEQNKQLIALKDKQISEKIKTNNQLKSALTNVNKEKLNLSKNISDLSNSCINKKLLSIALEENDTLNKQLELSQQKIKEAKPHGEMEINKLKDENTYFRQTIKDLENEVKKHQNSQISSKNSPKKDNSQTNRQTRIFEPSNTNSENINNYGKILESRGPCRYFPKCKWGDTCKWDHPRNIVNHKPRTYNSVPLNQQRVPQNQANYKVPTFNSKNQQPNQPIYNGLNQQPKQPVVFHGNMSKPPPHLYNPPPYNPYYQSSNPQLMNDSLPNQLSANFSPQYNVVPENCNLIHVPLVPCNDMYNV